MIDVNTKIVKTFSYFQTYFNHLGICRAKYGNMFVHNHINLSCTIMQIIFSEFVYADCMFYFTTNYGFLLLSLWFSLDWEIGRRFNWQWAATKCCTEKTLHVTGRSHDYRLYNHTASGNLATTAADYRQVSDKKMWERFLQRGWSLNISSSVMSGGVW